MTDMQSALATVSNLPQNVVMLNPAGTWSFVGAVDIRLSYFRRDGQPLTEQEVSGIRSHGAGLYRKTIGSCTWPTREAAIAAADAIGATVSNR